ncbi:MAG TPA: glycoside hydrolase family 3 N-terminal domain-containing protein, partial [Streptosporangiaceae bacterium]
MATSTAVSVPAVTGDARADLLLARMSLTDKLRLLEWVPDRSVGQFKAARLRGTPRLGIPTLRLVDGPPGEAALSVAPAMTAPLAIAATFSRADAYANGTAIGRDARALGDQVVALPVADLVRDPAWSEAGSTFGEDPLLAGQTAAAEITGIQNQHTMALARDYIGADGGANVVLDTQTLHEVYLQPFADAVRARVAAIMCAGGTVGVVGATPSGALGPGAPDCDNAGTLTRVLRRELGFAGFVASGWGANPATQSLNSGLDTGMTGPVGAGGGFFRPRAIRAAIADGSLSLATVNRAAGAVLAEMDRFGLLGTARGASDVPVGADEAVAARTAQDAATLLKNNRNALPLTARDLASLALIGPGAGQIIADGQAAAASLHPAGNASGVQRGRSAP